MSTLKTQDLEGGTLDFVHWEENRLLRIWTPPGERFRHRGGGEPPAAHFEAPR